MATLSVEIPFKMLPLDLGLISDAPKPLKFWVLGPGNIGSNFEFFFLSENPTFQMYFSWETKEASNVAELKFCSLTL